VISDPRVIEIAAGPLSVGLAPEVGGSLAHFRIERDGKAIDLMRPLSDADRRAKNPVGAAMFPMVPFANRIADNEFSFRGRTYRFTANNPPERFHVHGTGWHSEWSLVSAGPDRAVLELVRERLDEPYSYRATQTFAVTTTALTVTTMIRNRGAVAMPFGFGQHPWFEREADVELRFDAGAFWIEGWDHVASERIATPPELAFTEWRRLPRARRNNCYGGWGGRAEIRWPSRKVGLRIDAEPVFRHLMLFTDPLRKDFCLEPQTNAVTAFNLMAEHPDGDDLGVIILEPGQSAGGSITFTPFAA
jgi:aldose 1-epimerase